MIDESPLNFPKMPDRQRIMRYDHFDKLGTGDHFSAFALKGERSFTEAYNKLRYVSAPFAGLISRVMADMMYGEKINVDFKDQDNQAWSDDFFEDNKLMAQLYESELANSRRGDDIFKIRIGTRNPQMVTAKPTIIVEQITAAVYFPVLDQAGTRYTAKQDVIATFINDNGRTYLHKEIQVPGYIFHEMYLYDPTQQKVLAQVNPTSFGFPLQEETGIDDRTLIFHVPNFRDGTGFFGTSDYADLEPLFFALNNRLTKTDNILDKHSDPILAVPPGVINEKGQVNKSALGMFEVDNENPGFNKPEYIVWNANLDSAFKQIDNLIELLYTFSGISPASTGDQDKAGGQAESGRALKFKLLSTIRKRNQKIIYYDQMIKDMSETAQKLALAHGIFGDDNVSISTPERPTIMWGDGIIQDQVEAVETATARIDNGTMSRADAIASLDGKTPDEAKDKVAEIDKESGPAVPVVVNNLGGKPAESGIPPLTPPVIPPAGK